MLVAVLLPWPASPFAAAASPLRAAFASEALSPISAAPTYTPDDLLTPLHAWLMRQGGRIVFGSDADRYTPDQAALLGILARLAPVGTAVPAFSPEALQRVIDAGPLRAAPSVLALFPDLAPDAGVTMWLAALHYFYRETPLEAGAMVRHPEHGLGIVRGIVLRDGQPTVSLWFRRQVMLSPDEAVRTLWRLGPLAIAAGDGVRAMNLPLLEHLANVIAVTLRQYIPDLRVLLAGNPRHLRSAAVPDADLVFLGTPRHWTFRAIQDTFFLQLRIWLEDAGLEFDASKGKMSEPMEGRKRGRVVLILKPRAHKSLRDFAEQQLEELRKEFSAEQPTMISAKKHAIAPVFLAKAAAWGILPFDEFAAIRHVALDHLASGLWPEFWALEWMHRLFYLAKDRLERADDQWLLPRIADHLGIRLMHALDDTTHALPPTFARAVA